VLAQKAQSQAGSGKVARGLMELARRKVNQRRARRL